MKSGRARLIHGNAARPNTFREIVWYICSYIRVGKICYCLVIQGPALGGSSRAAAPGPEKLGVHIFCIGLLYIAEKESSFTILDGLPIRLAGHDLSQRLKSVPSIDM
jgi:hypothetical protein